MNEQYFFELNERYNKTQTTALFAVVEAVNAASHAYRRERKSFTVGKTVAPHDASAYMQATIEDDERIAKSLEDLTRLLTLRGDRATEFDDLIEDGKATDH